MKKNIHTRVYQKHTFVCIIFKHLKEALLPIANTLPRPNSLNNITLLVIPSFVKMNQSY